MIAENRPEMEYRVVVVKRPGNLGRIVRVRVTDREWIEHTLYTQEWASGRPTAGQLADLVGKLALEVEADIITRWGSQLSLE